MLSLNLHTITSCAALWLLAVRSVTASVQSDTVFAEQYGYPLVAFARLASPLVTGLGTNQLYRKTQLSTPDDTTVVLPNVDTLYATTIYDLAKDNLEIQIPKVKKDHYWSYAFYDPYGSNYLNLGSTADTLPGTYLMRRAADVHQDWGYAPCSENPYNGYINSPVTQGVLLIRVVVNDNGTDFDYVKSVLQKATVNAIPRSQSPGGKAKSIYGTTFLNLGSSNGTQVMKLLARLNHANPAFDSSDPASVQKRLKNAGITNGKYAKPATADPDAALAVATTQALTYASTRGRTKLNNGWTDWTPIGMYGDNFKGRTAISIGGYLALSDDQAFYPQYSEADSLSLAEGEAYIYEFGSKPPLDPQGFWSLTMYNESGYLVENDLNKYLVGDRSNITYADGTKVYGKKNQGRTGSFDVLVQRADQAPPANWTANWLPAPTDGGSIQIPLRLYEPSDDVKDATWDYPVVRKISAILP